ncbi:hypothetical protein GMORB2_0008 [Geosmithia morbida]|uniref:Uncharacterized protein n=1 Tax=Geosmithia morbida TaxID=1094350 RepID=A0A9P5D4N6_9HYPO|nr:uncharacterized protein GMORB2_0008 [Geosmithia morbida]KAF4126272.1 hypothetical protein GMORB2_0008 [Geosmithia morbida]
MGLCHFCAVYGHSISSLEDRLIPQSSSDIDSKAGTQPPLTHGFLLGILSEDWPSVPLNGVGIGSTDGDTGFSTFLAQEPQLEGFRRLRQDVWLISLPRDVRHVLVSIHEDSIWVSREQDVSVTNGMKAWVEDSTGIKWNRWPLKRRKRMLQDGETRVLWKCTCDSEQWEEVALEQGEIVEKMMSLDIFLACGERRGTSTPTQVAVRRHATDSEVSEELRKWYRLRRGWVRLWFSIWRLEYCDAVKHHQQYRYASLAAFGVSPSGCRWTAWCATSETTRGTGAASTDRDRRRKRRGTLRCGHTYSTSCSTRARRRGRGPWCDSWARGRRVWAGDGAVKRIPKRQARFGRDMTWADMGNRDGVFGLAELRGGIPPGDAGGAVRHLGMVADGASGGPAECVGAVDGSPRIALSVLERRRACWRVRISRGYVDRVCIDGCIVVVSGLG